MEGAETTIGTPKSVRYGEGIVHPKKTGLESRLGADIYQEQAMLDEFLQGSGDMHSLCAKMVFADELKDVAVKDIKKVRPDLRKKVKAVEFNCGLL